MIKYFFVSGCLLKEDSSSSSRKETTKDIDQACETAEAGVCGLRNLGNTCYMNSGLQCVMATPTILQFFLNFSAATLSHSAAAGSKENDNNALKKSNVSNIKLTKSFSSLAKKIYSGRYNVIRPVVFKDTLSSSHSQFKVGIKY